MTIAAGTRLGPYEVIAQIGAGGMGEVYEARDTKLGRNVAIKVLPAAFVNDPERLARFQREARMLAALNHPNIATIYGLEHSDGTHFLIMELVPGETLAERIKREGAVPLEEALKIAVQIAEALEAAHEKGIIHRDLKPANVKVTPEGKVKVLDFGLAKAFAGDAATGDPSDSPTLSQAATMQGVILGTAAYMSPEQARGKEVDKRTDIWAFGCVLYEMLTGKQAFEGEDITEILAAVVKTEPDWQALPQATPAQIRSLLHRCLQKDKVLRMQAAGDARIEIQEALSAPLLPASPTATVSRRMVWRWAVASALGCLIVATILGFAVWNLKPTPARPVTRTVINLPPGDQLAALDSPAIAISPDGTQLAYVAIHAGVRQIFLRALDSLEVKPLAGTEDASNPFFSPDGQSLGFFAGGKLKKIAVGGGPVVTLAYAPFPFGATWGSHGTIVFSAGNTSASLAQISDGGGSPQPMTHLAKGEVTHFWPQLLPGSEAVLFVGSTGANGAIIVQSLGSGERRELVPNGTAPHYVTTGHLIYEQGGNLMAAAFDRRRLQLTSGVVPVLEGILQSGFRGAVQYAVSATGSLAYVPGGSPVERLVWVSRNGTEQVLAAPPHNYMYPRLSPDGRRIAVEIVEDGFQLWLYDVARDALTRLASDVTTPVWTPDGKRIAFSWIKEGQANISWQPVDGSGGVEQLTTSEFGLAPRSFSPDGQLLAFTELHPTTPSNTWLLRLPDRKAQPFLRTTSTAAATFSPDGHWLAYTSDESGRWEVYVQPYPGPGGKYQISTEGGTEPVWNPDGRELFYRHGDNMMTADISTQPSFSVGKPKTLFHGTYVPAGGTIPYYDVSHDGQRFLMIKPGEQTLSQIILVQNWFEELKRRVPTGK